ncbi:MAG: hypothetical protein IJ524_00380 [Bacteroidales bacterium]|nr:hypothetical protein [Bacteroidales bacterium]
MKKILNILIFLSLGLTAGAQKLIEYTSGMGARDPENSDIWILYRHVRAVHEGMVLDADSAHYNTRENSFMAFRDVTIQLSDTTFIYGQRLHYDGNTRVVDIWDDTVVFLDGGTQLLANHLTYERNRATAYYTEWGYGSSQDRNLFSRQGEYNSDLKQFYIYNDVELTDSTMRLVTDTLLYNTETSVAHFESPTYIYSDSSTIYSELGDYNTDTRFAISYRASHVDNQGRTIDSDTLFYDETREYGRARGHVVIVDSTNELTCTGRYGETSQADGFSFVTDSAHVLFIDNGDSLFLHADTVYVTSDSANQLETVRANYHVKVYRRDAQAMCDSAFYRAPDSTLLLYKSPVLWYEHYQCVADTIELLHDSSGMRQAWLRNDCFALQQVDRDKFNQLKGHQGAVYFREGEPDYADVEGNAQMVFYITEEDTAGRTVLVGVNAGVGTSMRIYFDSTRAPVRVVTYDNPDMQTYPVGMLPAELKRLPDFRWLPERRPRKPEDVFVW